MALGDQQAARTHFSLARDWDALQFRTDSALNDIIREVALERAERNVHLVDAARRLASDVCDSDGIPGNELFSDHVHYTFDGDYQLARLLLPAVVEVLHQKRGLVGVESIEALTPDQCAARLAYNAWEEVDSLAAISRMLARPPFLDQADHAQRQAALEKRVSEMNSRFDQAFIDGVVRSYDYAIALNHADWVIRYNYASFLYQLQCYRQATPHIRYVVDLFGDIPAFRVLFGYCLGATGYFDQSVEQFRLARRLDKHSKPIEEALAWAQQHTQERTQRVSH